MAHVGPAYGSLAANQAKVRISREHGYSHRIVLVDIYSNEN
jgi:hypothetical protein